MTIDTIEQWMSEETIRNRFANRDLRWKRMKNGQVMALMPRNMRAQSWDKESNRMVYYWLDSSLATSNGTRTGN